MIRMKSKECLRSARMNSWRSPPIDCEERAIWRARRRFRSAGRAILFAHFCEDFLRPSAPEDPIDKRFIRINDRIRAREVRVIGADGEQVGVLPLYEAVKMAK